MITVGIRDLKNRLSEYLQYVKDGEKIIITEHKKIIAEISIPQEKEVPSSIEEKLKKLSKDGTIILAKRKKSCVKLPKIDEKLDWKSVYSKLRADRI
jgi:antitoxin (DNA-binding transcriptional repressor) of toxin-antitoxin stability system